MGCRGYKRIQHIFEDWNVEDVLYVLWWVAVMLGFVGYVALGC
jgi:hypothetical protein